MTGKQWLNIGKYWIIVVMLDTGGNVSRHGAREKRNTMSLQEVDEGYTLARVYLDLME